VIFAKLLAYNLQIQKQSGLSRGLLFTSQSDICERFLLHWLAG